MGKYYVHYTHFATEDIISNRPTRQRWPKQLAAEQEQLLSKLRTLSRQQESLHELVNHPVAEVRTLALGALFLREDPQDLPFIAALIADNAPTFPAIHDSANSMPGESPMIEIEASQTVGQVAQAMIAVYLDAAHAEVNVPETDPTTGLPVPEGGKKSHPYSRDDDRGLTPNELKDVFDSYWEERRERKNCASWFLVKLERATRSTSPLQQEYDRDIRKVVSEINALAPEDRAWTELFVRSAAFADPEVLIPDESLIRSLKSVGPDRLIGFLQHRRVTSDPDLWFGELGSADTVVFRVMIHLILGHAGELLRPQDAQSLLKCEEQEHKASSLNLLGVSPWWAIAAAELVNNDASAEADKIIDAALQRYPLDAILGGRDQSALMGALWRMRGINEKERLVGWFYDAMLRVLRESADDGPHDFLGEVAGAKRPDTKALLAAIVADPRFDQTDWLVIKDLLEMSNDDPLHPLVSIEEIYAASRNGDNQAVLAKWRKLLRSHYLN